MDRWQREEKERYHVLAEDKTRTFLKDILTKLDRNGLDPDEEERAHKFFLTYAVIPDSTQEEDISEQE